MTSTKHDRTREDDTPFRSDLERNPGIGQSKAAFMTGEPPEEIAGDNTVEGDVDNDATPEGAVTDYGGRRNK